MPSTPDSKEVLYFSTKEILNFSENWRSLYRPFPWPLATPREEVRPNNLMEYSTTIDLTEPEKILYTCKPYTTSDCFITSTFTPNNHSTPNTKANKTSETYRKCTHEDSSEAMSLSTTYPDTSLSADRCQDSSYVSAQAPSCELGERCTSLDNVNTVPSISRDIDTSCPHKYSCQEIYSDRNRDRRIRKTGIKGVRCIVSFALTDDPVKKRTQIQACSISVMILAIVSISFVLVYFTSNKYSVTNVAVPTVPSNSTADMLRTTSSTVRLPVIQSLTHDLPSTPPPLTTTQLLNDAPMNDKPDTISDIIQKIQKNLKSYPKFPRRSEPSVETKSLSDDSSVRNANESRDAIGEYCRKCQKDVEVCMLNEESGIPVCINAVDRHDPTGCGGLCALETEACQLVDRARGVRVCRALSSLRCTPQQWRCHNGLCVARSSRCDGRVDCYDRSDEMHCECDLSKHFRCGHSTSCFPNSKLCDGTVDCWDGRDEVNCTNTCPDREFTCNNGQCITSGRFCDGLADCADGSDEPSGCDEGCGANEWRCGNKRCVPRTVRCDGVDNCGDRTDELECF